MNQQRVCNTQGCVRVGINTPGIGVHLCKVAGLAGVAVASRAVMRTCSS